MIFRRLAILGVAAAIVAGGIIPGLASPQDSARSGDVPAVFFPQKIFEFAPVIEGADVVHNFVVQNKGRAPLLITNVRTG
jgi:hypothetical protein